MSFLDSLGRDSTLGAHDGAPTSGPEVPQCSRKGCRAPAQWQVLWNNPKIHTPERRKVWLACGDHREWLQEYLTVRRLWKETLPLANSLEISEPGPGDDQGPQSEPVELQSDAPNQQADPSKQSESTEC